VKYQFIYEHRNEYRLEKLCHVMNISRSGYYRWLNRPESNRSRRLYGSPKITQKLRQSGQNVSERTVSRIMKQEGIKSRTVRKFKATTNSNHTLTVHETVLEQNFTADSPNQKWVTDITYIPTREGWLYLASVMDLYSRKIVGWHMAERMTKDLVMNALRQAYRRRQPRDGVIHHSDRS
jgi:putative transposase